MDDTAFHYSRTLRIIMLLSVLLPILIIGALLWYFYSDGAGDSTTETEDQSNIEEECFIRDSARDGSAIRTDFMMPLQQTLRVSGPDSDIRFNSLAQPRDRSQRPLTHDLPSAFDTRMRTRVK